MEKLTLENIAPYLPYGLIAEFFTKRNGSRSIVPLNIDNVTKIRLNSTIVIKPILRPMDLTKPIIVEGKEITPIVELSKMVNMPVSYNNGGELNQYLEYENEEFYICTDDYYYTGDNIKKQKEPSLKQFYLFKKLYEWKFDVDGLIEKGLAIDVNTLETNPYN